VVLGAVAAAASTGFAVPASAAEPTFVDPTARVSGDVVLGHLDYVAPFARLTAGRGRAVHVGDESDFQDSVAVSAARGDVSIGDQVILAHGSAANGPAELGEHGTCPGGASHCPSFVGFNSLVDRGNLEKDAMVLHLARVGPGVTIPSGRAVISGANVTRDSQVAAKTVPVTAALRAFMAGVIEVNVAFAEGYTVLEEADESNVHGINYDPDTAFNPGTQLPTLGGVPTRDPHNPNRVIGDVSIDDEDWDEVLEDPARISLRADEGFPFESGSIEEMGSNSTWHALEHSHIQLGDSGEYGSRSLVHGGATPFADTTITGRSFKLGDSSVFFRSRAGDRVRVGRRSIVQDADLASRTTIPSRTVVEGTTRRRVEW
jgi:carbonic anhydrase/acetyltransferase-like protein (isoleucine patch superfamily)